MAALRSERRCHYCAAIVFKLIVSKKSPAGAVFLSSVFFLEDGLVEGPFAQHGKQDVATAPSDAIRAWL